MKPNIGIRMLHISVIYLAAGLVLGLAMGISKSFWLASVHSHTLLLGWAAMAISGIVYLVLPECADSRLAPVHFWGHNLGLPIMLVSLAMEAFGRKDIEPVIGVGSVVVLLSLMVFAANLFRNAALAQTARAPQ